MNVQGVSSPKAEAQTNGLWSATLGAPWDDLPEVPPDGIIQLSFSFPVNLQMLQSALTAVAGGEETVGLNVTRCQSPNPIYPLLNRAGGLSSSKATPTLSLDYEDSCASVVLRQPLAIGQPCDIKLLAGSTYSSSGPGPLSSDLSVSVYGLRSFKIPLRQDYVLTNQGTGIYSGVMYRRFNFWLPHGLSTRVSGLADQMDLCQVVGTSCTPMTFNLTLVQPGLARMFVPDLLPGTMYQLSVKASSAVLDGFGLQLEASKTSFWANDNGMIFTGPGIASSVALFELSDSSKVSWPFLTRASSNVNGYNGNAVSSASVWAIPIVDNASATQVLQVLSRQSSVYVPSILSSDPYGTVQNDPTSVTQELALSLDSKASSVHVIHTCCNNDPYSWPPQSSASVTVVTFSSLQASLISSGDGVTAWVSSAAGTGGPVSKALVRIFSADQYGTAPYIVGQCTTESTGSCFVPLSASSQAAFQMSAVVTYFKQALVLPTAGYWSPPQNPPSYVAKLVVDRLLVRPGETLFATLFLQSQGADGSLSLPASDTLIQIRMDQGWDPSGKGPVVVANGTLDPTSGTFHTSIPVPTSIRPGVYSASVRIPSSSSGSSSDADPSFVPNFKRGSQQQASSTLTFYPNSGSRTSSIDSVAITVSDPRPPTADLQLSAPSWALPNSTVSVRAQATSYLGTSVSGANMTLTWTTSNAQGIQTLLTNVNGSARALIILGGLPSANTSAPGDTLSITLTWRVGRFAYCYSQPGSFSFALAAGWGQQESSSHSQPQSLFSWHLARSLS
jgi:hypothetical protein